MRTATLQMCLLAVTAVSLSAFGQKYPDRPVRIIVPSAAGGGYDLMGRAVARKLAEQTGVNFFIENRVGAGTVVGTQAAAAAAADGYTLVVGGPSNMVFNAGLYKNLPYDPAKDFTTVSLVVKQPYALLARNDLPQTSVTQLVDAAKKNPKKLTIATAGAGTGQHMAVVSFMNVTGADMLVVHYKGAQQVYPDLISGRVDLVFDTIGSVRQHVDGGKVRLLAMATPDRHARYPQVPTVKEAGFTAFEVDSWIGLFAPSRTPMPIVERLRDEIDRTMKAPDFRAQMEASGVELMTLSGRDAETFVKSEIARWTPLIRQAGISAD